MFFQERDTIASALIGNCFHLITTPKYLSYLIRYQVKYITIKEDSISEHALIMWSLLLFLIFILNDHINYLISLEKFYIF